MVAEGVPSASRTPGRRQQLDLLDDFAVHVRSFIDVEALAPLQRRRRHGQRHGRARRARRVRGPADRARDHVRRARRLLPEPPGRSHQPRQPEATSRRGSSMSAPTSALRSTAMPTVSSSSTTRARRCRDRPPRPSSQQESWPRSPAPRSCTTASAPRPCPRSSASEAARRSAPASATASSRP